MPRSVGKNVKNRHDTWYMRQIGAGKRMTPKQRVTGRIHRIDISKLIISTYTDISKQDRSEPGPYGMHWVVG